LKIINSLQNPSAEIAEALPDVRFALNNTIGIMYYGEKKFDDAIEYFLKALKDKKYANGYYLIGNCLWEQKKILNARMAFAKAQLFGESGQAGDNDKAIAPKAKERMEQLHRALQNGTLIGIERQYKRAQDMPDEDLIKRME